MSDDENLKESGWNDDRPHVDRPYPLIQKHSETFKRPELRSSVAFESQDLILPTEDYDIDGTSIAESSSTDGDHATGGLLAPKPQPHADEGDEEGSYKNRKYEEDESIVYRNDWLGRLLPASRWIRTYNFREDFCADLIAGITVGIVAVPIGMSEAQIAGLPVQYGLYSSFVPLYIYTLFGSSREMIVGSAALMALVLQTGLHDIVYPNGYSAYADNPVLSQMYETLAIQVAFLSGIVYIVMGLLRLGFIMDLLRYCVVSGFTTGAVVLISLSQLSSIVGYSLGHNSTLPAVLKRLFTGISQFDVRTFFLGTCSIILLVNIKRVGEFTGPRFKYLENSGPIIVTTLSIFVSYVSDSASRGIPVVGFVPSGFPDCTVALWTPVIGGGRTAVLVLSVITMGFMKHLSMARQFAEKGKYYLNPSDELIGLGLSNLGGAAFQSMPVMAVYSRCGVNLDAGGETNLTSAIAATFIMFCILALAPMFESLPEAVLSSIVIMGVCSIVDINDPWFYWKNDKFDFFLWCMALFSTMIFGVDVGIITSVGISLLLAIAEKMGYRRYSTIQEETEKEYDDEKDPADEIASRRESVLSRSSKGSVEDAMAMASLAL